MTALNAGTPRYVFYIIGDGMGMGPVQVAQNYLRAESGEQTATLNMLTMPVTSFATTRSASSPVTDSAAAGTALATGTKTVNSMLGVAPDSTRLTSIAERLHADGWGVGLVTTVAPDDATPGAFYAHVPSRKMYEQIGRQFIESGFEYLAGSTLRGATGADGESTGLLEAIGDAGISLAFYPDTIVPGETRRAIQLNSANLNSANVGYTIDDAEVRLTLPMMTRAAIEHLKAVSPERFFVMIEGGNIDHALHANDAATAIADILMLDEVVGTVLDFAAEHPDETLVVITADHDTGGLTVGNKYTGYNSYPELLRSQRISKDRMNDMFKQMIADGASYDWDTMRDFLADNLGLGSTVELTDGEEETLRMAYIDAVEGRGSDQTNLYSAVNSFVAGAVDLLNMKAGYGFTTPHHTGNPVPVMALGEESVLFGHAVDNTDIPELILSILGYTITTEQ